MARRHGPRSESRRTVCEGNTNLGTERPHARGTGVGRRHTSLRMLRRRRDAQVALRRTTGVRGRAKVATRSTADGSLFGNHYGAFESRVRLTSSAALKKAVHRRRDTTSRLSRHTRWVHKSKANRSSKRAPFSHLGEGRERAPLPRLWAAARRTRSVETAQSKSEQGHRRKASPRQRGARVGGRRGPDRSEPGVGTRSSCGVD
jgi:hypothetical protein